MFGMVLRAKPSKETVEASNAPEIRNDGEIQLSDVERMADLLGVVPSFAGTAVTPRTSMKVSIVFACVRLLAGAIAQLPVKVHQDTTTGRQQVEHPYARLLSLQPTPMWSAALFWEYIVCCMLLHGDGFALILRTRNGDAAEFLPVSPIDVEVRQESGRLVYAVRMGTVVRLFDQDDMLHFPGFGFDGKRSMSVIRWGAYNSVGLQIAMEEFSGDYFANGAQQSFAVIKSQKWDPEQQQAFRTAWAAKYGGASNRNMPLTISSGLDVKELSINAKDSQLLEQRDYQVTDIARAFGIPSFLVNQEQKTTSWGSGISEIGLSFLRYTLMPHLTRFSQELTRKLFLEESFEFAFETGALLRGTTKERFDAYRQGLGGSQGPGWLTPNEVRRMERMSDSDDPNANRLYNPTASAAEPPASEGDSE